MANWKPVAVGIAMAAVLVGTLCYFELKNPSFHQPPSQGAAA